MQNFQDRVAVITGAGSGFGREFALIGAGLGMKLVLADIQEASLKAVLAEIQALGANAVSMKCDVSNATEMDALGKLTIDTFGGVNLVFNNAGVAAGGLAWENTINDWQWVLGVNLWGVIHGVRVFTPLMLAQAQREADYEGHIVNTASMAGLLSPPLMAAYNVSKHAVVALSETLFHDLNTAQEGRAKQIACSVLCPAFVPTGINQSHRARPETLKNTEAATASMKLSQTMTDKAVLSGKMTANDIAEITFDAIRKNRFYIITHPKIMATVQLRLDDIANQTNPRDPFSLKEDVRPKMSGG